MEKVIMYVVVGAILAGMVKNASGTSSIITAGGTQATGILGVLAGK